MIFFLQTDTYTSVLALFAVGDQQQQVLDVIRAPVLCQNSALLK